LGHNNFLKIALLLSGYTSTFDLSVTFNNVLCFVQYYDFFEYLNYYYHLFLPPLVLCQRALRLLNYV